MGPSSVTIGGLALIVGILAFGQRPGGWEHRIAGRFLGILAAGLFAAWSYLEFPIWLACVVTVVLWSVCLWFVFTWVQKARSCAGT